MCFSLNSHERGQLLRHTRTCSQVHKHLGALGVVGLRLGPKGLMGLFCRGIHWASPALLTHGLEFGIPCNIGLLGKNLYNAKIFIIKWRNDIYYCILLCSLSGKTVEIYHGSQSISFSSQVTPVIHLVEDHPTPFFVVNSMFSSHLDDISQLYGYEKPIQGGAPVR